MDKLPYDYQHIIYALLKNFDMLGNTSVTRFIKSHKIDWVDIFVDYIESYHSELTNKSTVSVLTFWETFDTMIQRYVETEDGYTFVT